MIANVGTHKTEPRLGRTLRGDLKTGVFWSTVGREFDELKTFYIEDEKKLRLVDMRWYKRWFFFTLWLLKSLLLKLTPTRRILLFLGLIFGFSVIQIGNGENIVTWSPVGELLVLFVLMLELKDKLLARDELEAGRRIQQALMPQRSPKVEGWSVWLYTRPASEVGGDLVDFLSVGKNRRGAVLADVSGKGLQAALLTAKLQASIRALAQDHQSVSELAGKVNEIFHQDTPSNMFASLLYVEFSPNSGHLRFVNAGHLPPLLLKPDGVHEMARGELALGLVSGSAYKERTLRLQNGDVFLAYSDGLSEAKNKQGEFFGVDRLFMLLQSLRDLPVDALAQSITKEVERFVGDARANDDLSLIVLKRT